MKNLSIGKKSYSYLLILAVLSGVCNINCGSAGYTKPITKFRDATSVVVEGTRIYISELNKIERDKYILKQESKKDEIDLNQINTVQVFGPEGLQARMDALDALSNYGDLLLKLANSDAPEKITAQATGLKSSLENLTTTVNNLSGAENTSFKAAIGPATVILGTILEAIAQHKIKEGLDKAILGAESPVNNLIIQIGEDLRSAYAGKQNAFSQARQIYVSEYNGLFEQYKAEKNKGDQANQDRLLTVGELMRQSSVRISEQENRWEDLGNADPVESLNAMAKAHTALINYAKSKQKIGDFQTLVDSIEFFATRAEQFGTAIRALSELN